MLADRGRKGGLGTCVRDVALRHARGACGLELEFISVHAREVDLRKNFHSIVYSAASPGGRVSLVDMEPVLIKALFRVTGVNRVAKSTSSSNTTV